MYVEKEREGGDRIPGFWRIIGRGTNGGDRRRRRGRAGSSTWDTGGMKSLLDVYFSFYTEDPHCWGGAAAPGRPPRSPSPNTPARACSVVWCYGVAQGASRRRRPNPHYREANFHATRFVCFFAFPFDFPRCSTLTDPAYIYPIDAAPRFVNAGTSISSDADSGTTNGET